MEDIYRECDFITIHVPALDSTKGMINKETIGMMKDGVVILNFRLCNIGIFGLSFYPVNSACNITAGKEHTADYQFLYRIGIGAGRIEYYDTVTGNEELDAKFVKEAAEAGFVNLKGHRSVGGMRASIYNAMPKEGVEKLVAFMKEFEAKNA